MKIIFISNYFTHHQRPLSDQFASIPGIDFTFLETERMSRERLDGGWSISHPDYVEYVDMNDSEAIIFWENRISEADVVIAGSCPTFLLKKRDHKKKLTFCYSERLFKSNLRLLKWFVYARRAHKLKGSYMLCASAYTASDYNLLGYYRGRCFKWGYFPEVKRYENVENIIMKKGKNGEKKLSILWVGRLIGWKHPEAAIYVAKRLKEEKVEFSMIIIGIGPLQYKIENLIKNNKLENEVSLLGAMKPENVRDYMEASDIFLFSSDRNEGWGAVLNESMNSACAVVASHEIGSVPFLVKDGVNGLIFKDRDWGDMYKKVLFLALNPDKRKEMGINAYKTITKTWCAEQGVKRLLQLINVLMNGEYIVFREGPCASASLCKDNWYSRK